MPPQIVPVKRLSARVAGLASGEKLDLGLEGIARHRHAGWTRPADARVPHHPRGTPIRNTRQVSLVSVEELAEIAAALDLPCIEPAWLDANIVLAGVEQLSFLPAGTRIFFSGESALIVEAYNSPCIKTGNAVARASGNATPQAFVRAASRRRGIVASVERSGRVDLAAEATIVVPEQWLY